MLYEVITKRIEKELDKKITDAYASLKKTFISLGHEETKTKSEFINYEFKMRKKTNKLIGMTLSAVEVEIPRLQLQYSFLNTRITSYNVCYTKLLRLDYKISRTNCFKRIYNRSK